MGPIKAVGAAYVGMFNFTSRARRAEYWWFMLFQIILIFGATFWWGYGLVLRAQADPAFARLLQSPGGAETFVNSELMANIGPLSVAYIFGSWLPVLSISIRRLHDTDHSGWWYFINAVPLIGPIWFLVLMCLPGTHGNNRFGPDPIPDRAAPVPAHPAFASPPDGAERDRVEVARRAAARDYYKRRVLPSIHKAEPQR